MMMTKKEKKTESTESTESIDILILAAGKGSRMLSTTDKLLHPLLFEPIIIHALRLFDTAKNIPIDNIVLIVNPDNKESILEAITKYLPKLAPKIHYCIQNNQLGTGHAVLSAKEKLFQISKDTSTVLIMNGDSVLFQPKTIQKLITHHRASHAFLTLTTAHMTKKNAYGRIKRDKNNAIEAILESHGLSNKEKKNYTEINAGLYSANKDKLFSMLEQLKKNKEKNEYYFTDLIYQAYSSKLCVTSIQLKNAWEGQGINTQEELSSAHRILQKRINTRWMKKGVTLIDPRTTWISSNSRLSPSTILYPSVYCIDSDIEENVVIKSGVSIESSKIQKGATLHEGTVIEKAYVGENSHIGPLAHIRPHTSVGKNCKIGNFVELKASSIGDNTHISHLSYLGDATVGSSTNIGAGCITCNFDGRKKHPTTIGNNVFIGSDAQLIAPITIGDNSFIAAGTTVTQDIDDGSFAIARPPLTIKKNIKNINKD